MSDSLHLTVEEAARRLSLSDETVRRWLRNGKLKGVRLGERRSGWRIPSAEIDALLRQKDSAQDDDRRSLYVEAMGSASSTWTLAHLRAVLATDAPTIGLSFEEAMLVFGRGLEEKEAIHEALSSVNQIIEYREATSVQRDGTVGE